MRIIKRSSLSLTRQRITYSFNPSHHGLAQLHFSPQNKLPLRNRKFVVSIDSKTLRHKGDVEMYDDEGATALWYFPAWALLHDDLDIVMASMS
jgi:hypothetical protein